MNVSKPEDDWEVRVQDKCVCSYCDLSGVGDFEVWMNLTIDHITPGAGDDAENKTVACFECNSLKRGYMPDGTNRKDRIADARRHVQGKRKQYRKKFEKMMEEIKKLT